MSMIAYLQRISPDLVTAIQANPEHLEALLDDTELSPEQEELEPPAAAALELGKDWHGIHYLLTGLAWATLPREGQAILGGTEIGEDLGYGAARILTPPEVTTVAQALQAIPPTDLAGRYDVAGLIEADIYPGHWSEADREGLMSSYEEVVAYYEAAANAGEGMLLYLL